MKRLCCLFLSAVLFLTIVRPATVHADKGDVALVQNAFAQLTYGLPWGSLLVSDTALEKAQRKPIFKLAFMINDLVVKEVPDNPDMVSYSCTIPGAAGVATTMLYDTFFIEMNTYSPPVKMSGTLKLVTDSKGVRRIDVSEPDNPFYLLINIRYFNESDSLIPVKFKAPGEYTDEEFNTALNSLLFSIGSYYAETLGREDYIDSVVIPDFKKIAPNISKMSAIPLSTPAPQKQDENASFFTKAKNFFRGSELGNFALIVVGLIALFVIVGLIPVLLDFIKPMIWQIEINNATHAYTRALSGAKHVKGSVLKARGGKVAGRLFDANRNMEACILLHFRPAADVQTLTTLCRYVAEATNLENITSLDEDEKTRRLIESTGGWALAALGRCITSNLRPEELKKKKKNLDKAKDAYNDDIKAYNEAQKAFKETSATLKVTNADANHIDEWWRVKGKLLRDEVNRYGERISRGIFLYALEADACFLELIAEIACDTHHRYSRFVVQGAIMGLIPFLQKYAGHPDIKPIMEGVLAARAQIISSDSQFTFFEVRVPSACSARQYAAILGEVLWCAKPSAKIADTNKFITLTQKEIPGVMDLLCNYPLRIIDPANVSTEGFFKFEPYKMANWVEYTPPLNIGPVIRRFNEILDMTIPNSTGLNLRLFTDIYTVCPVLFHEYCHYKDDHNEASVFLCTQLFSQQFYTKYRKRADPKRDFAFIHLQSLLGMPPSPERVDRLNNLILINYGPQIPEKEAGQSAQDNIDRINAWLVYANSRATWCAEKSFPLLADNEDKRNYHLLFSILKHFASLPRSIDQAKFNRILCNWEPQGIKEG